MFFMTPHILKNLFTKSSTRMHPFVVREPFERARGELVIDIGDCIFCKACERKCPSQCITIDKKAAVWNCDPMSCVFCGICVEACPKDCLSQKPVYRSPNMEREFMSYKGAIKVKPKKKRKPADAEADNTKKAA